MRVSQIALALAIIVGTNGQAQTTTNTLEGLIESVEVSITADNFIRAATDLEFQKYVSLAGGINRFYHFREPTPVENQPTIRMNRDTLYSTAVVDISEGATLILPEAADRYMTAMVVNQDHFINEVFFGGGTYTLDMETFDTPYVIVYLRVLVDAADPEDVAAVNMIQDTITIEANASNPFVAPNYDDEAFEAVVEQLLPLGALGFVPDSSRMFGKREDVHPIRHMLGTIAGWGGLPEKEAFYPAFFPGLPVGAYKIEVPQNVPVDAFWSVSMYNAEGFYEPNTLNSYSINSVTGAQNADGSMTIHLGACDDGRVNCLPITEGWNYVVRLYRPRQEVLDGSWTFPTAQHVN
ncbi:DUF1214 domain-containing protein [Ruegeria sp. HKCCD4884]|uniref:DUF1214 domain-containing protein n=1 Tax=Ruegeria sp. HKCCD4884 TaxID=2683022 RepID=UPI001490FF80|nr:DUF1214 domain-containing protein [Ruegeria sp. HKCCD4884]NOD95244.1 DUF1214 domain-containing protein [Ruegeria sp. HKCCD4884]